MGRPGEPPVRATIGARRHAADLVPGIDRCLRQHGAAWSDVTDVIVSDGPGSFTGLRIGFATAAGIIREHRRIALWTGPSLMAAAAAGADAAGGPVAALYDALRGEVFAGVYQFGGEVRTLLAPSLTTAAALAASPIRPRLAVGDGAVAYPEEVRRWTGTNPQPAPVDRIAESLIRLAALNAVTRVDDLASWEPTYGRAAEAQVKWEKKHGKPLPDPARRPR